MIDLIGQKFNRLLVIKNVGKNKWNKYKWLCKCDCDNIIEIDGCSLRSGHIKSCGCLFREGNNTKHGHKGSKIYTIWQHMIQRCVNPNDKEYHNYGDRGITVCKRWRRFENFLKDMGECPKGRSLDRINNDKGYYRENCHWATTKQQQRNKRNNHLETYNGKTQPVIEWSEETGIPYHTLIKRLYRGWSTKRALTTPIKKYPRRKT